MIFSKEVKPLIAGIFGGVDATVIANGARGSGKTCLMQGVDEKPGLAALAVSEILSLSKQYGKSVTVSLYEIYQEQVFDVLDPKNGLVSVLENAQRKIQLKGLSQVPLRCMSEFWKLCNTGCSSHKAVKKIPNEMPRRNHRGLIIYVSSCNKSSEIVLMGKMNLIDMAGYEDARRKSNDGLNIVKNANVNKSLYALHHVINALNGNEVRVPYRESKLTHMLQDSLGAMNKILMVVCVNPLFCQDSIYMVNLASQSWQGNNRHALDSLKKNKSLTKAMAPSSHKMNISSSMSNSVKKITGSKTQISSKKGNDTMVPSSHKIKISSSMSNSVKKNTGYRTQLSSRKANDTKSAMKGRKLFVEESQPMEPAKAITSSDIVSKVGSFAIEEKGKSIFNVSEPSLATVVESSPLTSSDEREPVKDGESNFKKDATCELNFIEEGCKVGKENDSLTVNESQSPPLSSKLQELSNSLKMLHMYSTPLSVQMPTQSTQISLAPIQLAVNDTTRNLQISSSLAEPKTPEPSLRTNEVWERFNLHSSAMKDTLVQEYLKFLNTADKEELKKLKGIGEKRATYILELRQESPEPFKNLDDIQDIGLSAKQIKKMMKDELGGLFN